VIFLDETGMSTSMRLRRGRAPAGQRAFLPVHAIRSQNYSVAAAMSEGGIVHFKVYRGAYNRERFSEFLVELILKLTEQGKANCIFVMDNVAFHKSAEITSLIRAHGHVPEFLPPYTPELNPIEEVFNQWKHMVKVAAVTTVPQLMAEIDGAASRITPANCRSYYDHMLSHVSEFVRQSRATE
jgi:transposase